MTRNHAIALGPRRTQCDFLPRQPMKSSIVLKTVMNRLILTAAALACWATVLCPQGAAHVTAVSTGPGGTSLYTLPHNGSVWSKYFPDTKRPGQWTDWF